MSLEIFSFEVDDIVLLRIVIFNKIGHSNSLVVTADVWTPKEEILLFILARLGRSKTKPKLTSNSGSF